MTNLQLVKSEKFGSVQCDFYGNGKNEFYMTREEIGRALEYSDPIRAISKIHERHASRLDKYSVVVRLTTTDGKAYGTTVYTRKGIMEICRWSQQSGADAFMDFVWEVMDAYERRLKALSKTRTQKAPAAVLQSPAGNQYQADESRERTGNAHSLMDERYDT